MAKTPRPRGSSAAESSDDAFLARVLEFTAWARSNTQVLIGLVAVLVMLVLGGVYYLNHRTNVRVQAVGQLEAIQQTMEMGQRDAARTELNQFLERFGGTRYAHEARMLLGQLALEGGDPQEAIRVLEPVGGALGDPVAQQAAFLLASAYEDAGRAEEAERLYLELARRVDLRFQVRDALAAAARIRTDQGNAAGAAELYRRILETLDADDQGRAVFEMRLAEVEAMR